MGELFAYYLAADIAFVGGSLVDAGCQNVIEPISCCIPTLFGCSTYNFTTVCQDAIRAGAAEQVVSAERWYEKTTSWLAYPLEKERCSQKALEFVGKHKGASKRMADQIAKAVIRQ